jgi:hypothetical protein
LTKPESTSGICLKGSKHLDKMNQSFNRQQLLRLCKQAEHIDYKLTIKQLSDKLEEIYETITENNFDFKLYQVSEYFLTHDLPNKLILRKLNENIKRIYKDEQANRRVIISQVKTLLGETCPYWVIKTDIKSFYESIDREQIISKFHDESMLSYQSMYLLRKVFDNPILKDRNGVPMGMGISATISEIYLRKFDKWIRRFEGVYYYARFVDDIIIFSNSLSSCIKLINNLDEKLSELAEGLRINNSKTELYDGKSLTSINRSNGKPIGKSKPLEYLGYSFKRKQEQTKKPLLKKFQQIENLKYTINDYYSTFLLERITYLEFNSIQASTDAKLTITIASKKIKKIKTRIVKAFLDFGQNKDFVLLEKRIKFLTGNYSIRKSEEGNNLRAGIYYNYLQVNDLSVFHELNSFYRKALFSKASGLGVKISLTPVQKKHLRKHCFVAGFKLKVYNHFTYAEMRNIIKCW